MLYACVLIGLSQLCNSINTIERLIFVVPETNFKLMKAQPLVTSAKKVMRPNNVHCRVCDVEQFVLLLPISSGEST